MSLKLDELRKRLLQQPLADGAMSGTSSPRTSSPGTATGPEPAEETGDSGQLPPKVELRAVDLVKSTDPVLSTTIEMAPQKDRPLFSRREEPPTPSPAARLGVAALAPKIESPINQAQVVESVAKLFEQTKVFEVRFDELAQAVDVIERMTESAGRLFGPLRSFHEQLAQLATSFESMRSFQEQLAELGKTFEPMKLVHDQFAQLCASIQSNIAQLVKALGPAKDFRERILALARSLEQASELQTEFGELYSAFHASGRGVGNDIGKAGQVPRQSAAS
jgi:uncharacterized phage infection (PIP) family protein YhgE